MTALSTLETETATVAGRSQRSTTLLGLLSGLIMLGASAMRGWPFPHLTAAPWLFQLNTQNASLKYLFVALFYLGVAGFCWSWIRLLSDARDGFVTIRNALLIFGIWTLPLFVAPPLFSGDVYVYLVDGQAIARGFSPYETGVSAMGPAPVVHMVHPLWRGTTTAYGPVFMRMAEGISLLTGNNLTAGVMIFRALTIGAVLVMGASAFHLARRWGRQPVEAFVFVVLNPLTMLHLIGGVHNDALMLGLLFSSLAIGIYADSRLMKLGAIVLCVLAAAIKLPAFAGVLVLGWIWAGAHGGLPRRMAYTAAAGALGVAVFGVITAFTGMGIGWVHSLDVPGLSETLLAPANALARAIGGLFGIAPFLKDVIRPITGFLALVLALFLIFRLPRTAEPVAVVRAAGWGLLAVAWLGPAVYPWYLTLGVAVVGITGVGKMRRLLLVVVVLSCFLITPGGYGVLDAPVGWWRVLTAWITVAVMAWTVRYILRTNDFHPGQAMASTWRTRKKSHSAGLKRIS